MTSSTEGNGNPHAIMCFCCVKEYNMPTVDCVCRSPPKMVWFSVSSYRLEFKMEAGVLE